MPPPASLAGGARVATPRRRPAPQMHSCRKHSDVRPSQRRTCSTTALVADLFSHNLATVEAEIGIERVCATGALISTMRSAQ
jgi:hypothetical protein